MSLRDRQTFHEGRAQTALEMARDYAGTSEFLLRIEMALHELGVTIAEAATPPEMNEELALQQAAAIDQFREVLDRHQAAIEKAHQGLSPWGEIKLVGEELQTALGVVRALI